MSGACCSPSPDARRSPPSSAPDPPLPPPLEGQPPTSPGTAFVELTGGTFRMGTDDERFPADGEGPVREVTVSAFTVSAGPVTNAAFAAFVADTGWVTLAEREGWSFVFAGLLPDDFPPTRGVVGTPWWRQVHGADWRHPEGPHSDLTGRDDHPVVHVSWTDAVAFARWVDADLPTEAEWEYAARGGLDQARYAWGNELTPAGRHMANIWQGTFPVHNTCEDGWYGTSPVGSFPPNGFGLHDVAGNVWEWCTDWFDPVWHRDGPRRDPVGPPTGTRRVMRGGSYLCHESYCNRYRVGARSSSTPDATTGNLGFRVVRRASGVRHGHPQSAGNHPQGER